MSSRSAAHSRAACLRSVASSASSSSISASSALALEETHLPWAFFLFLFVPYSSSNASRPSVARSSLQSWAAFLRAFSPSACSSSAVRLTQRLMLRYRALKASRVALDLPRSALHSAFAARRSASSDFATAPAGTRSPATIAMTTVVIFMLPTTQPA